MVLRGQLRGRVGRRRDCSLRRARRKTGLSFFMGQEASARPGFVAIGCAGRPSSSGRKRPKRPSGAVSWGADSRKLGTPLGGHLKTGH